MAAMCGHPAPQDPRQGDNSAESEQRASAPRSSRPAGVQRNRVTAVSIQSAADRIRVIVEAQGDIAYQAGFANNPDRLFFDLANTELAPHLKQRKMQVGAGIVKRVRVAQHEADVVRLVLDLPENLPYSISAEKNPSRLKIEVLRKPTQVALATLVNVAVPSKLADRPAPVAPKEDLRPPATAAVNFSSSIDAPGKLARDTFQPRPAPGPTFNPADAPGDPAAAAQWYRKLADQGNAEAQFRLANFYVNGSGVPKDLSEAAKWYRRAADQGHAVAQNNLGVLYANGWGISKNDYDALRWFLTAAEQGNPAGQSNVGAMCLNGRGTPRNEAQAADWLRKAADRGVPEAQYSLGTLYAGGRGVTLDDGEAVKWFRKSAEQAYVPAKVALGKMYLAGRGASQNSAAAIELFREAADRGSPEALYQLGLAYEHGSGLQADSKSAAQYFQQAAEKGFAEAQVRVAEMYRDGRSFERDYVRAYAWFAVAASNNNGSALTALNELAPRMTITEISTAQQRALKLAGGNTNRLPNPTMASR